MMRQPPQRGMFGLRGMHYGDNGDKMKKIKFNFDGIEEITR